MTKTPPTTAGTGAVFPEEYEDQLANKISKVKDLFAGHKLPEIEVHRSSKANFRMRAEFRVWHEGQDLCYVMFEQPDSSSEAADAAAASSDMEAAAEGDSEAADGQQTSAAGASASETEAAPLQSNGRAKGKSNKKRKGGKAVKSTRKKVSRVRIDDFPVASQLICSLMPLLRQELVAADTLREKLFQVNFHTTLSKHAMVTMAYHKQVRHASRCTGHA
jgi:tRNA/tmRNA/rRNA uracil-C5-methylase (TrmA/RlmC/RlmD family)